MIAFLDANALIYSLEGEPSLAQRTHAELRTLAETWPGLRIGMSKLSRLECRVGPLRNGDVQLLAAYDTFFALPGLLMVPLSRTVIDLATTLRAETGLKTPDALQAASCLQLGDAHAFLTGDKVFSRVPGLRTRPSL